LRSRSALGGAVWAQALLGGACALSVPHIDGTGANPCTATQQCPGGQVCFLDQCRGRAGRLGTVLAEVRPPSSTPYGSVQRANVDMRSTVLNDFELGANRASGTVTQQSSSGGIAQPVANAHVTFTAAASVIPGRPAAAHAQTASAGTYGVTLPWGNESASWKVEVLPPAPQPPLRLAQGFAPGTALLDLSLPASSALVHRSGTAMQGGIALAGAQILAVDVQTLEPIAAPTNVDAQGKFSLALPPSPPDYLLRVGGPSAAAASSATPIPTFAPMRFSASDVAPAAAFPALPPSVRLVGQVVSAKGAPVAGALVYAASLNGAGWELTASATADAAGNFSLNLLSANYAVEAAPPPGSGAPALSGVLQPVAVAAGAPALRIVCPPKVSAQGTVLRPDGAVAGVGTQIVAIRTPDALVFGRMAEAAPTDMSGSYTILGDPGEYRVHILPPASSGLPRRQVSLTLSAAPKQTLPPVTLYFPLEAVGTVRGPPPFFTPVPGATVDFFALDVSAQAVPIGSGVSDSQGRYRAVLPDAEDPTLSTP
jgi:hypothetical protein